MSLINLVKKGTSQKDKSGWRIFYAHPEEHWKGRCSLRDCGGEKGTLPCVVCVGNGEARPNRSCEGVLRSADELTSLAILTSPCLKILINPTGKMDWSIT